MMQQVHIHLAGAQLLSVAGDLSLCAQSQDCCQDQNMLPFLYLLEFMHPEHWTG